MLNNNEQADNQWYLSAWRQTAGKPGGLFTGNFKVIRFICSLTLIAGVVYKLFFRKYKEAAKLTKKI